MNSCLIDLDRASEDLATQNGGKVLGLYLARQCGAQIPHSLVLPAKEIYQYIGSLQHYKEICDQWLRQSKYVQFDDFSQKMIAMIAKTPLPTPWVTAILDATVEWDEVILRSSVLGEDASDHSWAGAFESCKALNEISAIETALKIVIKSLFAPQALQIFASSGKSLAEVTMAVIVQPYLRSTVAGVALSRNPNNLFVKPFTSPFTRPFTWSKLASLFKKSYPWGYCEWSFAGAASVCQGVEELQGQCFGQKTPQKSPQNSLHMWTSNQWQALSHMVASIDQYWQGPVDVEWLIRGELLFILQVRRVVGEAANLAHQLPEGVTLSREKTAERFPGPMSPLGWDVLKPSLSSATSGLEKLFGVKFNSRSPIAVCLGGWIYANDQAFKLTSSVPLFMQILFSLPNVVKSFVRALLMFVKFCIQQPYSLRAGIAAGMAKGFALLLNKKYHYVCQEYDQRRHDLLVNLPHLEQETLIKSTEPATAEELLSFFDRSIKLGADFMETDFSVFFLKEVMDRCLAIIGKLSQFLYQKNFVQGSMERSISLKGFNPTTHMVDQLRLILENITIEGNFEQYCLRIKSSKSLYDLRAATFLSSQSVIEDWHSWLAAYGTMRESWDIRDPSWSENSQILLDVIGGLKSSNVTAKAKLSDSDPWSLPLAPLAQMLRGILWRDEDQRHLSARLLANARCIVIQAAKALELRGQIGELNDIFFLTLDEIRAALRRELPLPFAIADYRRCLWERTQKVAVAASVGAYVTHKAFKPIKLCSQRGASDGIASGPAIFGRSLDEAAGAPKGAILFTDVPRPEFVALYPILGGIVTKVGGLLAHGFIAARECGLPAITGYDHSRGIPYPGQIVKIDGSTGAVFFEDKPKEIH